MNSKSLFIVFFIISSVSLLDAQQITPVLSTEALKMISKDKKLVILDVRTPGEFSQGHIIGAINIDVHNADANDQYLKLDKNAKYIVICRTKNRSGVVSNFLTQNGFKSVYQVTDGMVGWIANNLPVVQ
jgi:rhodanese-related sulfurtransferase